MADTLFPGSFRSSNVDRTFAYTNNVYDEHREKLQQEINNDLFAQDAKQELGISQLRGDMTNKITSLDNDLTQSISTTKSELSSRIDDVEDIAKKKNTWQSF